MIFFSDLIQQQYFLLLYYILGWIIFVWRRIKIIKLILNICNMLSLAKVYKTLFLFLTLYFSSLPQLLISDQHFRKFSKLTALTQLHKRTPVYSWNWKQRIIILIFWQSCHVSNKTEKTACSQQSYRIVLQIAGATILHVLLLTPPTKLECLYQELILQ